MIEIKIVVSVLFNIQSDNSMTIDCNKKRAIYILKIHSLNQEYFNSPDGILKLHNIYCCSFYVSSIWDLSSQCTIPELLLLFEHLGKVGVL